MGIDVIGDSPTMAWMDPDHPLAEHAVGTQGVSLCCRRDYQELYKDLPLDTVSVSASLPPPLAVAGLSTILGPYPIGPGGLHVEPIGVPLQSPGFGGATLPLQGAMLEVESGQVTLAPPSALTILDSSF